MLQPDAAREIDALDEAADLRVAAILAEHEDRLQPAQPNRASSRAINLKRHQRAGRHHTCKFVVPVLYATAPASCTLSTLCALRSASSTCSR